MSFAATFAVVMWIWVEHFILFRKFGLEDATTIFLNSTLLFWMAGTIYGLLGPAHGLFGHWSGSRRKQ